MTKAGKRLLAAAEEAFSVVRAEQPAARVHMHGHAYVPEDQWQPIATAPTDGTQVLGCWHRTEPYSNLSYGVVWREEGSWVEYDADNRVSDPTHWMPLPPPPNR